MTDRTLVDVFIASPGRDRVSVGGSERILSHGDKVEIYHTAYSRNTGEDQMNTPEFKVGQKYRIVDNSSTGFASCTKGEGDILTVSGILSDGDALVEENKFLYIEKEDVLHGYVELIQDTQDPPEDLPTEFAVGQLWYVVSEKGFVCPRGSSEGDIIEIARRDTFGIAWFGYNHIQGLDDIVVYEDDLNTSLKYIGTKETHGHLVGASTEASEDASELSYSEVPEEVESVSQASTESPTDNSKDILWHIISRAEHYNGHSQFSVSDMDLKTLVGLTRMLGDYVTEWCELRLSWGGDHMGYYTADIYEIAGTSSSDDDKILMQIEKVTGIS